MRVIEVPAGRAIPEGKYQARGFNGCRGDVLKKVLANCEHKTPAYVYCLFRNKLGYIVRRKNRVEPEQEQAWEDVAEIIPVEATT